MDLSTSSHHSPNNHDNNTTDTSDPELSPLEQEVLDEYAKLAGNLDNVLSPLLFIPLRVPFPIPYPFPQPLPVSPANAPIPP